MPVIPVLQRSARATEKDLASKNEKQVRKTRQKKE
jgi:hypothetical protein